MRRSAGATCITRRCLSGASMVDAPGRGVEIAVIVLATATNSLDVATGLIGKGSPELSAAPSTKPPPWQTGPIPKRSLRPSTSATAPNAGGWMEFGWRSCSSIRLDPSCHRRWWSPALAPRAPNASRIRCRRAGAAAGKPFAHRRGSRHVDHISQMRLIFGAAQSGVAKTYAANNVAYAESKHRFTEPRTSSSASGPNRSCSIIAAMGGSRMCPSPRVPSSQAPRRSGSPRPASIRS